MDAAVKDQRWDDYEKARSSYLKYENTSEDELFPKKGFINEILHKAKTPAVSASGVSEPYIKAKTIEALNEIGFDTENYGFQNALTNKASYTFGGEMEWTDHSSGLRLVSRLNDQNQLQQAHVSNHSSYSHKQEEIDAVNEKLKSIISSRVSN